MGVLIRHLTLLSEGFSPIEARLVCFKSLTWMRLLGHTPPLFDLIGPSPGSSHTSRDRDTPYGWTPGEKPIYSFGDLWHHDPD